MKTILKRLIVSPNTIRMRYYKWYNRLYFKYKGITFGKGLNVYNKIYITGYHGNISIGNNFTFTSGDSINPICANLLGCIHTGRSDAAITIGDNVGISSACIWAMKHISIGNNVNIGGNCMIIDTDAHQIDFMARRRDVNKNCSNSPNSFVKCSPIIIEDDVWIGAKCQILKGVTIGARSIIGAGSVVTKSIPSDCIAAGNPCHVIRQLK